MADDHSQSGNSRFDESRLLLIVILILAGVAVLFGGGLAVLFMSGK